MFTNSEKDLLLFIDNLRREKILEDQEADLVKSAFNFDEKTVSNVFVPLSEVIFLQNSMKWEKVENIHSEKKFSRYPVLNRNKKIVGIFETRKFYLGRIKNKNSEWQNHLSKKVVYFSLYDRLDEVLIKLQISACPLGIVQEKNKVLGLITLKDILNCLIERPQPVPLLPYKKNALKSALN